MKLSKENRIDLLTEIRRYKKYDLTEEDYNFYFKKDEWSESEVIRLFAPSAENVWRLFELIESSCKAGKLMPSRYARPNQYPNNKGYYYYYDPFTITHWAIVKGITIPDKLTEWHDQQIKLREAVATQLESGQTNQSGIDVSVQSEEKPLSETERATLLKILLCMAMDAYSYDPDDTNNKATGKNNGSIKVAMQKYGLDVDPKTLSKYLKESANRNPTARPRKP